MTTGETLIEIDHVSKKFCRDLKRSLWYGLSDLGTELLGRDRSSRSGLRRQEFVALDGISLKLRRGECLGLIGLNGSGKSTLLKLINGLMPPDSGSIRVRGRIGALIELTAGFNPLLTGRENIYISASVLGMSKREVDRRYEEIVAFSEVGDSIDAPVQSYSSGMKARLGFSVAAHLDPDILLVDEVLAVGDSRFNVKCLNHMRERLRSGIGTVFVSHNLYQVQALCTSCMLLHGGRLVCSGEPSKVLDEYERLNALSTAETQAPEQDGPLRFLGVSVFENNSPVGHGNMIYLRTHRPLAISLNYVLDQQVSRGIQIGLLIKNAAGHNVAGFTTKIQKIAVPGDPAVYTIRFDFPTNTLLQGNYSLSFSAFDDDYSCQLGYWSKAANLRVETDNHNGLHQLGCVAMEHSVSVARHAIRKED